MDIAFLIVGLAVSVLAVTAIADRIDVPAPLVLIVAGAAVSYLPGVLEIRLEPDVVLFGLLPPLLYSTAITASLVDFNANRRVILLLSIGLVVFTTFGVGAIVHLLVPKVPWAAAIAIGAVVAPPDAVAATAIGRRIGLPRRTVTILEGESLFNDATALVAVRTAIAAGGLGISATHVARDFVLAAGGGVVVGLAFFAVVAAMRKFIIDPLMDTAISLVVPFAAYIAAEEIHGSGVIAVVIAGLLLGHNAPVLQTAQSRIAERTNWRTIAFVLENTVFLLIGLQAKLLFQGVKSSGVPGLPDLSTATIVAVCVASVVAVIGLRMAWVFPARYLLVLPGSDPDVHQRPRPAYTFLLGWAGMRGVVTLAAAFILPDSTPYLGMLRLVAFSVVAGTLLIQGLSLPWFTRHLNVSAPDPADDALARATLLQQASKAGFVKLKELDVLDLHGVIALIKQRTEQRNFAAWERLGTTADEESPSEQYNRIRREMIDAERKRVLEIRSSGRTPSDVVTEVLAMLDVEESMLEVAQQSRAEVQTARSIRAPGEECDHLAAKPVIETGGDGTCHRCLEDGTRWVALRECLECGNVACCDSSPGRHATAHFHDTSHPVMQSAEPGEEWRWCYVHHLTA